MHKPCSKRANHHHYTQQQKQSRLDFKNDICHRLSCKEVSIEDIVWLDELHLGQMVLLVALHHQAGIIGPFFGNDFIDDKMAFNDQKYLMVLKIIVEELKTRLGQDNFDKCWAQQDGVGFHLTDNVLTYLKTTFRGKLISEGGRINWPAFNSDQQVLDYWLDPILKQAVGEEKDLIEAINIIKNKLLALQTREWQEAIEQFPNRVAYLSITEGRYVPNNTINFSIDKLRCLKCGEIHICNCHYCYPDCANETGQYRCHTQIVDEYGLSLMCNKIFKTQNLLDDHQSIEHQDEFYRCPLNVEDETGRPCNKSFRTQQDLEHHQKFDERHKKRDHNGTNTTRRAKMTVRYNENEKNARLVVAQDICHRISIGELSVKDIAWVDELYIGKPPNTVIVLFVFHYKAGRIGPFFLDEIDDRRMSINGKKYLLIMDTAISQLKMRLSEEEFGNCWILQDGARYHTVHDVLEYLRTTFRGRVISKGGRMLEIPI